MSGFAIFAPLREVFFFPATLTPIPVASDDWGMDEEWCELAVYPDRASAEIVAGLLRTEAIPVRIEVDEPVPGLVKACSVWVPAARMEHARALCAQTPLSEEEWTRAIEERGTDDDGFSQERS